MPKRYAIGRSPASDIVLDDPSVSARHAFLVTGDDVTFELIDVGSSNGVFLLRDGQYAAIRFERVGLADQIAIGTVKASVAELLAQVGVHPEVFVSYSREDADRSRTIADYLSNHGLRVWRDNQLKIAKAYDEQLEEQLKAAKSILVLWSQHSVKSQWVRAEAGVGLDRGVLIPTFIEPVEPPLLFRSIQAHFVTDWDSEERLQAQLAELAQKIDVFLGITRSALDSAPRPPVPRIDNNTGH